MKFLISSLLTVLMFSLGLATSASANVNNFEITDYKIDYKLSRDDQQRSRLATTETITAKFPNFDQNHGLERLIPNSYDGHPTNLKIESITNSQGAELPYSVKAVNDTSVIRIGESDKYVHGLQSYKISYSQQDVTKYFTNPNSDEFYWNTNGNSWKVPIDKLTINLTVDEQLVGELTADKACYFGLAGSNQPCYLQASGSNLSVAASQLKPGENITIALGFKPGTFAQYQMSAWSIAVLAWWILQLILLMTAAILLGWISTRYYRQQTRIREHKPIAPEYLVPKDASVVVSSRLMGLTNAFTALVLDLAIRRYINIHEVKSKKLFRPAEFEIEIIKPIDDLRAEEKEVIQDIFQDQVAPGARLELKKISSNYKILTRISDNDRKLVNLISYDYGLRTKSDKYSAWYRRFALIALLTSLILVSPVLLVLAVIGYVMSLTISPLTDKGLALTRYLKGLKMYIKQAETDRIKTLQSPQAAEKVGDITNQKNIIKVYEKLLPYAVLFGLEKQWNKELGHYYESLHQQPSWYIGAPGTAYSAANFSNAMNSFSVSSSTSGGSSGSGSSGGGGSGGGGGGW